jgi:hypothetical protein
MYRERYKREEMAQRLKNGQMTGSFRSGGLVLMAGVPSSAMASLFMNHGIL